MSASEIIPSHLSASLKFELYPLRFRYSNWKFREFSPNVIRGAFGAALRRIDADAYHRYFAPARTPGSGPSGLADPPRPFVLRIPPAGDGREVGLNLFLTRPPALDLFTRVMAQFGELQSVGGTSLLRLDIPVPEPRVLSLRVAFLTPTEIKGADQPDFRNLMARIRDRISTLRALYGSGPLEIDFKDLADQASSVTMTRSELQYVSAERVSRGTGQRHSIGGFIGFVEYAGEDLSPFVPYLEVAKFIGVGRQTVWGKGEISCEILRPEPQNREALAGAI